ncbi:MAG: lytic transglycosylase domain-containing protein [Mariprofundaceae bacterium]|nr:lytic transglycosylase domain-containing protein [Mariprofundaceae bacterium]
MCYCTAAQAQIFKYLDAQGNLYITDKKMPSPYRLLETYQPWSPYTAKIAKSNSTYNPQVYKNNVQTYLPHIHQAAKKHNIDPQLLHAIVDTESAFNPQAKSKAGAIGLMQLMPKTAEKLGVKNSYDPKQNIAGGALYVRQLLDMFKQDVRLSVAAYNAGENAVIRAGRAIPNYPETKRYVQKVMKRYLELQKADAT